MRHPERQIRALYNEAFIRVYQAYSDEIADSALEAQTFVSPPFSMSRMTWIKPSFLWMMYRSGWGKKDEGQKRILAIDVTHDGFDWALAHSCPSHAEHGMSQDEWKLALASSTVRVQWDPERDLFHNPLAHRAIQIGLSGEAVRRYTNEWITRITDVTSLSQHIHEVVRKGDIEVARLLLPREKPYSIGMDAQKYLEIEREQLLATDHTEHEEIVGQLQDIGTADAIAAIRECALSDDAVLREQAQHRLARIAAGGRGGTQFPTK
jgi:Domain of unknown function (DUF4291)